MEQLRWNVFGTIGVIALIVVLEIFDVGISTKIFIAAVGSGFCVSKYLGRHRGYGTLIGGLIGLLLAGSFLGWEARTTRSAELQIVEKKVEDLNATLPRMVGSEWRLDRVSLSEDEVQYFWTNIDAAIGEIDVEDVKVEHGEFYGSLLCQSNGDQKMFPDHFDYHLFYFDMNDAPMTDFTITKADCE